MIKTIRSKQLAALWAGGKTKIARQYHRRILILLDRLDVCEAAVEMNLPGYDFHQLKGFAPTLYTVHVNGPMCITFEFSDGDAYAVDFENYH